MAVKTFTTGEVLTAADTNTYLANSGLVFVKSQTIGSGVPSVTVSSAFSSDYDNYVITLSGGATSGETNIGLQFGSKTTNYKHQLIYASWNNTVQAAGSSIQATIQYVANGGTTGMQGIIQVSNPFLAKNTFASGSWNANADAGYAVGQTGDTTSYTSFNLVLGGGTMTGGTVTVYGYRKA